MVFAEIILPLNLKGTFTYQIPPELEGNLRVGMRVLVPFKGRKIYTGIVLSVHREKPEHYTTKDIISVLDEEAILPIEQLKFWQWLSDYYLCNLGEIYRTAFPSSLKLESETYLKLKADIEIDLSVLNSNEMFLIQALEVKQLLNLKEIESFIPKKEIIKTVKLLIDMQYIEIDEKIHEKYKIKEVAYIKIKEDILQDNKLTEIFEKLQKAPKQNELLVHILSIYSSSPQTPIRKSDVLKKGTFASSHLKALIEKNIIEEYSLKEDRLNLYEGERETIEELTEVQKIAEKEIDHAFANQQKVLLHGVTSSGKTHIYLKKIEETYLEGKTVLVLVPEVSLSKQITSRLEKKYGKALGFYHQKLSDFERIEIWKKIKEKEIRIIIGTRNALFLPLEDLGLIVVDEEHDNAYKPKEVFPYFNAKDAAIYLADIYRAHLLLSSATPSLESYYLSKIGKLEYVYVGERYLSVAPPTIKLINFKEQLELKKINGFLSEDLQKSIYETLMEDNQVMLLHNKRGYANVIECESCGYVTYCPNCDVVMTYHKSSNELKCHYCGSRAAKPTVCPKCQSTRLNEKGVGVEQIYENVVKLYPDAHAERMDIDAMRKKYAYEQLYQNIKNKTTKIVVGTQMMSKGLDFDGIELVAIPRADQLLYIQDFRAEEKAYQLITQFAGRAGRKSGKGKMLLQTYQPKHPLFQLIKEQQTKEIYDYFLEERKKFNYPPYTRLIFIELKHRKPDKVERASTFMGSLLRKYLPEECIFGPESSPIARLNTFYQFQILLKLPRGKNYKMFKNLIQESLEKFNKTTAYQSIKKTILVDY